MIWYPYTGAASLGLVWPSEIACTSLSLAALVGGCVRLAMLRSAGRARSCRVGAAHVGSSGRGAGGEAGCGMSDAEEAAGWMRTPPPTSRRSRQLTRTQ